MRELLLKAIELPVAERYRLAFLIAENIGHSIMTKEQEDSIYGAYLGICTLKRCADKWGLDSDVKRACDLLRGMSEAFPFIADRVATSALR